MVYQSNLSTGLTERCGTCCFLISIERVEPEISRDSTKMPVQGIWLFALIHLFSSSQQWSISEQVEVLVQSDHWLCRLIVLGQSNSFTVYESGLNQLRFYTKEPPLADSTDAWFKRQLIISVCSSSDIICKMGRRNSVLMTICQKVCSKWFLLPVESLPGH